MLSRFFTGCVVLIALPMLVAAQTSEAPTNQKVLEDLKDVRAALTRMIELLEKGHRLQVLVARIQLDSSRIATLESQRVQLKTQEQDLQKEASEAAALVRAEESGVFRTAPGAPSTARIRNDQATRQLDEVRRALQTLDQNLKTLRTGMANMEKSLTEFTP